MVAKGRGSKLEYTVPPPLILHFIHWYSHRPIAIDYRDIGRLPQTLAEAECQGYGEYCTIVGWDAGAAAMRFRGRGQASRVPWLYGTVPYDWAEHTNSLAL